MSTERLSVKPRPRSGSKGVGRAMTEAERATLSSDRVQTKRPHAVTTGETTFRFARNLTPLQTHDLVTEGLPVVVARELMASFHLIDRHTVLSAVGISERTLQRGNAAGKRLDSNASDRTLRLALVAEQAIDVLGSQEAAERWLSAPAMGLDRRRPIDLLQSTEGTEMVKTLLTRMDHGVYA